MNSLNIPMGNIKSRLKKSKSKPPIVELSPPYQDDNITSKKKTQKIMEEKNQYENHMTKCIAKYIKLLYQQHRDTKFESEVTLDLNIAHKISGYDDKLVNIRPNHSINIENLTTCDTKGCQYCKTEVIDITLEEYTKYMKIAIEYIKKEWDESGYVNYDQVKITPIIDEDISVVINFNI